VIGSKEPVHSLEKREELLIIDTDGLRNKMWTDAYSPILPYLR